MMKYFLLAGAVVLVVAAVGCSGASQCTNEPLSPIAVDEPVAQEDHSPAATVPADVGLGDSINHRGAGPAGSKP